MQSKTLQIQYDSNFGNISIRDDKSFKASGAVFLLNLEKIGYYNSFKSLIPVVVPIIILFVGIWLPPYSEARFGLVAASLFGLLASYIPIQDQLPESGETSIAEGLVLIGLLLCLIYTIGSTLSLRNYESERIAISQKLDHLVFLVMAAIAAIFAASVLTIL